MQSDEVTQINVRSYVQSGRVSRNVLTFTWSIWTVFVDIQCSGSHIYIYGLNILYFSARIQKSRLVLKSKWLGRER